MSAWVTEVQCTGRYEDTSTDAAAHCEVRVHGYELYMSRVCRLRTIVQGAPIAHNAPHTSNRAPRLAVTDRPATDPTGPPAAPSAVPRR
jgi:hypothetical protein